MREDARTKVLVHPVREGNDHCRLQTVREVGVQRPNSPLHSECPAMGPIDPR